MSILVIKVAPALLAGKHRGGQTRADDATDDFAFCGDLPMNTCRRAYST